MFKPRAVSTKLASRPRKTSPDSIVSSNLNSAAKSCFDSKPLADNLLDAMGTTDAKDCGNSSLSPKCNEKNMLTAKNSKESIDIGNVVPSISSHECDVVMIVEETNTSVQSVDRKRKSSLSGDKVVILRLSFPPLKFLSGAPSGNGITGNSTKEVPSTTVETKG